MANQPVVKDAADCFLPGDPVLLCCKAVDRTEVGLLDAQDNPVTFDRWPASRFFGHI